MAERIQGTQQTSPETKPFRFMDLSPELRNKIYSRLLQDDKGHFLQTYRSANRTKRSRWTQKPFAERHSIQPTILRTCKQVHGEATSILYANNVFEGENELVLRDFLEQIGSSIQNLRHIKVMYRGTKTHFRRMMIWLKDATSIQTLGIRCAWDVTISASQLAKEMGPMMRALHKARSMLEGCNMQSILDVVKPSHCADIKGYEEEFRKLIGDTLK